jgi:hypothetical protein
MWIARWGIILVSAGAMLGISALARAQIIAIGPPSFQSNDFPSLETLILDRLALGGTPDPEDLATLSHLAVLESIAMLADIQADMTNTPLGDRLEPQVRNLWDAAARFEERVSANPVNSQSIGGVQPVFNDMRAAYRDIAATLGGSAALSGRASAHLEGISRLTTATDSVMRAIEAEKPDNLRDRGFKNLDRDVRLLGAALGGYIQNVKAAKMQGPAWQTVSDNLTELLTQVRALTTRLGEQAARNEVAASIETIRRHTWQIEAQMARLKLPTDLERRWKLVRERLNVVSDRLGLPRVFEREPNLGNKAQAGVGSSPQTVTRIYRGPR